MPFKMGAILVALSLAMPGVGGATMDIDGELNFSRAKITMTSGKRYLAKHVTMEGDSISFARLRLETVGYQPAPPSERDYRTFPLSSVSAIAVPDGNRAALGAGIGALAGVACWGMLAHSSNSSMWEGAILAVPFLILPGAGIGALVGSGIENWEPVYSRHEE